MSYFIFATLLLAAASGIFSLYQHAKKLQQNSYSLLGYFKWLKDSYTAEFALSALLYCAITLAVKNEKEILALILASVLFLLRLIISVKVTKNAKKKLAFTVFVKMFYIIAILMLGALVIVAKLSTDEMISNVFCIVGLLLSTIIPVLTFVAWLITYPISKLMPAKPKKETKTDDEVAD